MNSLPGPPGERHEADGVEARDVLVLRREDGLQLGQERLVLLDAPRVADAGGVDDVEGVGDVAALEAGDLVDGGRSSKQKSSEHSIN